MTNVILITLGTIIPVIIYLFRKEWVAYYLLAACFFTEFFYINVFGGKVRFYHLTAVVVILLLYKYWMQILQKKALLILATYVVYALVSALISSSRKGAIISWCSLVLNVCVCLAIVLVLQAKYITIHGFKQAVCVCTIISCIWSVIQYVMFFGYHVNVGLSLEQKTQINIGMLTGFRTEANVFGRSLSVIMFLLLPELIGCKKKIYGLKLMYILALFCSLIDMTRTTMYPAVLLMCILGIFYFYRKKIKRYLLVSVGAVIISAFIILLGCVNILPTGKYTLYKWQAFVSPLGIKTNMLTEGSDERTSIEDIERGDVVAFEDYVKEVHINKLQNQQEVDDNINEVTYDVSSSYRISNAMIVIRGTLESPIVFLLGKGWGQTYYMINGYATQAGGGDWINVLAYTGAIGLCIYIILILSIVKIAFNIICKDNTNINIGVSILSCIFILCVAGLLSSNIIMPDFWIIVGIAIYLEKKIVLSSKMETILKLN